MPLRDVLEAEQDCDWLLEWVDGCGTLDREIFVLLLESDGKHTVDAISAEVDRDRSTTYRAVKRLEEHGYLDKEQRTYENGGYCYRYGATDPDIIAEELEQTVSACQSRMESLVAEFRETYCKGDAA